MVDNTTFSAQFDGMDSVADALEQVGKDHQAVGHALAKLPDIADAAFGEYGVPQAHRDFLSYWQLEITTASVSLNEVSGKVSNSKDAYSSVSLDDAALTD